MADPDGLSVRGGAAGIDARLDDLELLATRSIDLAGALAGVGVACHGMLLDADLVASAVIDPVGAARVEAALLGALDGPSGLSALAVRAGARGAWLRTTAASHRAADELGAQLIDVGRLAAGALLATPLGLTAGALVVGGGAAAGVDWGAVLAAHPGLLDTASGMVPGLIAGLTGLPTADVPAVARLLGLLYPDGTPEVADGGTDPAGTVPPRGVGDLVAGLARRDHQGQVDIRVLTHTDGTHAFIVDVPGTKDWHLVPLQHHDDLNDLSTNLHAMAGDSTAYEEAVALALRRAMAEAGAAPDSPVMLVGHSQGGLVAADLATRGEFTVTHLVTAGAPIGNVDVPDRVQVLSLENSHDLVPHLDAADNPDRANWTTVTFDSPPGDLGSYHSIGTSYAPAATALDTSTDPSVAAWRTGADAFLNDDGDTADATTHVYLVSRG